MPGGDQTGPMGSGPMTGRAAGYCAGYGVPGYMNPLPGRGFWGRGRGFRGGGRGWRHSYYATGLPGWMRWGYPAWPQYGVAPSPQGEMEFLQQQANTLQAELEDIERRMKELESAQAGSQEA